MSGRTVVIPIHNGWCAERRENAGPDPFAAMHVETGVIHSRYARLQDAQSAVALLARIEELEQALDEKGGRS